MADFKVKARILDKCMELQNEMIENISFEMNEAQKSANEYGQPKDRYDSYRTQLLRRRDLYAKQLYQAMKQKDLLDKVDPNRESESVSFGSVVITEDQKIFIAIGLGRIVLSDETWFVISPNVPFFESMKGKKKGDSFGFRDRKIRIIDVY